MVIYYAEVGLFADVLHSKFTKQASTKYYFFFFSTIGVNGGRGVLATLAELDRELLGPLVHLPLLLSDAQGRTSYVSLRVLITDVNDNPMQPASKRVHVVRNVVSKKELLRNLAMP